MTSKRPFLLLRISFPGRSIFIQIIPREWSLIRLCGRGTWQAPLGWVRGFSRQRTERARFNSLLLGSGSQWRGQYESGGLMLRSEDGISKFQRKRWPGLSKTMSLFAVPAYPFQQNLSSARAKCIMDFALAQERFCWNGPGGTDRKSPGSMTVLSFSLVST